MLIKAIIIVAVLVSTVALIAAGVFFGRLITRKKRKAKKVEKTKENVFKATREFAKEAELLNKKMLSHPSETYNKEHKNFDKKIKYFAKQIKLARKYRVEMPEKVLRAYSLLRVRRDGGIIKSNEAIIALRNHNFINNSIVDPTPESAESR